MKFGILKVMDIPKSFILIVILFDEAFQYSNDANCFGCVGGES
jgi:hypothetical protein